MPNRIIKESICTSDNLDKLSPEAEVFFYRLMVTADDYGIMFAAPSILRSKCFPWKIDKVKDKDIEKWRTELVEAELIFLYEYEDRLYLKFTKWEDHQQTRANKSKFPTPDMEGVKMISNDINGNQLIANVPVIDIRNRNRNTIYEYTSDINLQKTLCEFVEMRNKIKKPMTEKAISLMLKKLGELTDKNEEKILILEQSILNSWKGVFPLKQDEAKKSNDNSNAKGKDKAKTFDNFSKREYDPEELKQMLLNRTRDSTDEGPT